jgi:hypothetical protein
MRLDDDVLSELHNTPSSVIADRLFLQYTPCPKAGKSGMKRMKIVQIVEKRKIDIF